MSNKMSKDRIEFNLVASNWYDEDLISKVASIALGVDIGHARKLVVAEKRIRCRPSQFARFIVLRNQFGATNGIKNLNAVIIPPAAVEPDYVDVSQNPAPDYEY